jgi:hypothetical protein
MPRVDAMSGHETTILTAALWLHDRGLWIVPCNGKVATKKDWPTSRVNSWQRLGR